MQIDPITQWSQVYKNVTFAKSSTTWYTPKSRASVSKIVTILGTVTCAHNIGSHYLIQFLGSPQSFTMSYVAFLAVIWDVESTMGRVYNTQLVQFLDSFSYYAPTSKVIFIVWQLPLLEGAVDLLPVGISPQHLFDYSNLKMEFTDKGLQRPRFAEVCGTSMPNMFSFIEEIKISYSCGVEHSIWSVKGSFWP